MRTPTTKLNSEYETEEDAKRHEKFVANLDPTSDGFENFYDSLWHSAIHDLCHKLSVGIQLLLEQKLGLPQTRM